MKDCKYCRESIHDEATVCPHCRRSLPGRYRWLWRGLARAALFFVLIFAGLVYLGSHADFHGKNNNLYAAMQLYGSKLTHDQADRLVDQIAKENRLPHQKAERVAVILAAYKMDPKLWTRAAAYGVKFADLKRRGILPPGAHCIPSETFQMDCSRTPALPDDLKMPASVKDSGI